jgi:succinate-acetate transporter protein
LIQQTDISSRWFTAGVTNLIVGIFELLIGNTFAYVIFGSLGGYFMSLGAVLSPSWGITEHYLNKTGANPQETRRLKMEGAREVRNAIGLFNLCWGAMFFVFLVVSIRSNVFMVMIFSFVCITCILSGIGDFQAADGHPHTKEKLDKVRVCDSIGRYSTDSTIRLRAFSSFSVRFRTGTCSS